LKWVAKWEKTACRTGCTPSRVTPSTWTEEMALPRRRLANIEWKYLELASPSFSHLERDCCQLMLACKRGNEWMSDVTPKLVDSWYLISEKLVKWN
jgi:hypothetical protein